MARLHEWLTNQIAAHRVEPNSGLGQAIAYLINHWTPLTRFLEGDRHNHPRTRNHRRAVLVVIFEYLARRLPDQLVVSQQVAAIPVKRVAPPETHFLEREDVATLFDRLPTKGPYALRAAR